VDNREMAAMIMNYEKLNIVLPTVKV